MGPWLIKALNVVLLGASCYLVAVVVTEIGAEVLEPSAIQPAAFRPESTSQAAAVAPSVILERNFFRAQLAGESQVVEVSSQNEPLEATKLPLRLLGTAASSNEARSRAAVEDEKSRKHLVLAVGDRLTEAGLARVQVSAIERTRIILDNAGRPEELALHEDDPNAVRPIPQRNPRQARRPQPNRQTLNDRLKALDGEDGQGLSNILSSARIVPFYDETGEMQGMKVDAIKSDSVFEKVGLVNGDIITEVNGIVIDRLEATSAIFDEFATAEEISVSAQRGSEAVILSASASDIMEQP